MRRVLTLGMLTFGMLALGCTASRVKTRSDGSLAIECNTERVCLERAHRACGEDGFETVGGRRTEKVYGTPGNEVHEGKNELYVRCNSNRPIDQPDPTVGEWSLQRDGGAPRPPPSAAPASSVQPSVSARAPASASSSSPVPQPPQVAQAVCRPGETQRCVGPGACDGGQACRDDSSGFGPCDCGTKGATAPPAASPDGGL